MKATYIKPATEIVMLGGRNDILEVIVVGGSKHGMYNDAAEGNASTFDDDEDDFMSSNTSLWDD